MARTNNKKKDTKKTQAPPTASKVGGFEGPIQGFSSTPTGFLQVSVGVYPKYPNTKIPSKQSQDSACYDLHAYLKTGAVVTIYDGRNKKHDIVLKSDGIRLSPFERALIPTGLHFDIPEGFSLRVHPRSGLAVKQGLTLINSEGVIDSDYVDQVYLTIVNLSQVPAEIKHDDRLAQLELYSEVESKLTFIEGVPELKGNRQGGFGSTGV